MIVNLRHAELRRRAADWSLEVRALLPDTLGAEMQLHASVHGDMGDPRTLQGSVRFSGERLVFGGWHGVLGARAPAAYLPGGGHRQPGPGRRSWRTARSPRSAARCVPNHSNGSRARAGATALRLPRLRADWQLAQRAGRWLLSVRSLDVGAAQALSSQVMLAEDGTAQGVVRALPLALAADIARWHDPKLPLAQLALDGTVRELDFSWDATACPRHAPAHAGTGRVADAGKRRA